MNLAIWVRKFCFLGFGVLIVHFENKHAINAVGQGSTKVFLTQLRSVDLQERWALCRSIKLLTLSFRLQTRKERRVKGLTLIRLGFESRFLL